MDVLAASTTRAVTTGKEGTKAGSSVSSVSPAFNPFLQMGGKTYLDGSDDLAMEAPSSAPAPRQVSRSTWRFAGPTSGTVAHTHSSLDSPSCDLDGVCRLRNDVFDVLRELLKMS